MSESVALGDSRKTPGSPLALRHGLAVVGIFLMYGGVTLLVELFSRAGDQGSCGHRAGVPCQEGTVLLGLGAFAFIAGVLVLDHLGMRPGWSEPAGVFASISFLYGTGGIGLAFAWNVVDSDSVIWSVVSGAIAVLPLWIFGLLVHGFFKGFWKDGPKKWAREHFWLLERLPQSKRRRRQLLRSRGVERRRAAYGRLEPETRKEKVHWALFMVESCVALVGGVLAAVFFIVHVS
ncbi:hypothetical protein [Streptomyces sp. cmx-18-6]|uniref:hypothetical protein n=1 Tax=Streptomyces sp. cmx-18-6 TaxID=2790930 RepID=UPI0039801392